jgi:hypothetical protein
MITSHSFNFLIIAFPALSSFCPPEIVSEQTITAAVMSFLKRSLKSDFQDRLEKT